MGDESLLLDTTNHDSTTSFFEVTSLDCLDKTNHESTTFSYEAEVVKEEPPQQKQKIVKSVTFFERVIVRPVLHVDDYTDEEWYKTWYLPTEKQRRKDEIRRTLEAIRDGKFKGCVRGLEKMCDRGKTKERRRIAVQEILEEQESQRVRAKAKQCQQIIWDAEQFKSAYRPHSRAARHVANAMGRIDEMAASSKKGKNMNKFMRRFSPKPAKNAVASIHSNDFGTFLQLDFTRN